MVSPWTTSASLLIWVPQFTVLVNWTTRSQHESARYRVLQLSQQHLEEQEHSTPQQDPQAAVLTMMFYGSEVWNTTNQLMHRLRTFHQSCLRRILHIRWFDCVTNDEVQRFAQNHSVHNFIAAKRLRWYGHVVRMPEIRRPN